MKLERLLFSKKFMVICVSVFLILIVFPSLFHYHRSVDGGYTDWSGWSICSSTCGYGIIGRYRNCTNPVPFGFGKMCEHVGPHLETKVCDDLPPCPVKGDWSVWTAWGDCDRACVDGSQSRTRECNNPAPSNGGVPCENQEYTKEVRPCDSLLPCPLDGSWSEWNSWMDCSVSCDRGIRDRKRSCDNPEPKNSGQQCSGIAHEVEHCTVQLCLMPTTNTTSLPSTQP